MRRVQPHALTLILTGYPAFEAALRAIREQVDDFLTKPTDVQTLLHCIDSKLKNRDHPVQYQIKRVSAVLAENKDSIIEDWYREIENHPEFSSITMSREERISHLSALIEDIILVELGTPASREQMLEAAKAHGALRWRQGYSAEMLVEEMRVLYRVLAVQVHRYLLSIDISFLIGDLEAVADRLHVLLRASISAYATAAQLPVPNTRIG
jgi:YesN/AraC family two-component response regulator